MKKIIILFLVLILVLSTSINAQLTGKWTAKEANECRGKYKDFLNWCENGFKEVTTPKGKVYTKAYCILNAKVIFVNCCFPDIGLKGIRGLAEIDDPRFIEHFEECDRETQLIIKGALAPRIVDLAGIALAGVPTPGAGSTPAAQAAGEIVKYVGDLNKDRAVEKVLEEPTATENVLKYKTMEYIEGQVDIGDEAYKKLKNKINENLEGINTGLLGDKKMHLFISQDKSIHKQYEPRMGVIIENGKILDINGDGVIGAEYNVFVSESTIFDIEKSGDPINAITGAIELGKIRLEGISYKAKFTAGIVNFASKVFDKFTPSKYRLSGLPRNIVYNEKQGILNENNGITYISYQNGNTDFINNYGIIKGYSAPSYSMFLSNKDYSNTAGIYSTEKIYSKIVSISDYKTSFSKLAIGFSEGYVNFLDGYNG